MSTYMSANPASVTAIATSGWFFYAAANAARTPKFFLYLTANSPPVMVEKNVSALNTTPERSMRSELVPGL